MSIIGKIDVDRTLGALHTHRDSYSLKELVTVSVRRPLLPAAVLFGSSAVASAFSFGDILYAHEVGLITVFVAGAATLGVRLGQLKLRSRELSSGDELSDVIWGNFATLNKKRREIIVAALAAREAQP